MKTVKLFFILCALAGSGVLQAQFILTFQADQMDPYIGKTFKIRVVEMGTGFEVGARTLPSIPASTFSIDLYVLFSQRDYQVDFYVDDNEDGLYSMPPDDHAWSDTVFNPAQDQTLFFSPDTIYTDIGYPNNPPYMTYDAVWGGKWENLTFGSTDSIEATTTVSCDSVSGYLTTKGVFGNPAPVEFEYAQARSNDFDPVTDTISYTPGPPWSGEIWFTNGEMHGNISSGGFELAFIGTHGLQQTLGLYTVSTGGQAFANGYFYIRELEVLSSTAPFQINLNFLNHVSCYGQQDGSISIDVSGGSPDYTFSWSNGEDTSSIHNLGPGEYDVTITDEMGCATQASYTITEPEMIITATSVMHPLCNGECDGIISLTITGGQPPYQYLWNTGSSTMTISGLCAGSYTCTIVDANGCLSVITVEVIEPEPLLLDTVAIVHETGGNGNGVIDVSISGGTMPYTYSWEMSGSFFAATEDLIDLGAGLYVLEVTDANGCILVTDTLQIQNLSAVLNLASDVRWFPNPVSSHIQIETSLSLTVSILDVLGHELFKSHNGGNQIIDVSGIEKGIYIIGFSDGTRSAYHSLIKVDP